MGVGVGVAGGKKGRQLPTTEVVCATGPEDDAVVEPEGVALAAADDALEVVAAPELEVGLGVALGVGLLLASGAATTPGAVEQVGTTVVTGIGFGVGEVLPIGAAVPPVDSAGLAEGAAEVDGAWLGLMIGDWLGFVGVVRLGGGMLLWLGVSGTAEGVGVCCGVGVGVWARIMPVIASSNMTRHSRLICTMAPDKRPLNACSSTLCGVMRCDPGKVYPLEWN